MGVVAYQHVTVPLGGGVDEGADPHQIPPGFLSRAINVSYDADGRIRKRRGYDRALNTASSTPTHAAVLPRGPVWVGECAIYAHDPGDTASVGERVDDAFGALVTQDATPGSRGTFAGYDSVNGYQRPHPVYLRVGNYDVLLWHHDGTNREIVVYRRSTGALVERVTFSATIRYSCGAVSTDGVRAVIAYSDGTDIYRRIVDTSAATMIGSAVAVNSAAIRFSGYQPFSVYSHNLAGANGWVFVWTNAAANELYARHLSVAGVLDGVRNTGQVGGDLHSVWSTGTDAYVAYHDVTNAEIRVMRADQALTSWYGPSTIEAATGTAAAGSLTRHTLIAGTPGAASGCSVVTLQEGVGAVSRIATCYGVSTADPPGVASGTVTRRAIPISRPIRLQDSSTLAYWCRLETAYIGSSGPVFGDSYLGTAGLVTMQDTGSASSEPVAAVYPGSVEIPYAACCDGHTSGTLAYVLVPTRVSILGTQDVVWHTVVADIADWRQWYPAEITDGRTAMLSGGVGSHYDGVHLTEHSFLEQPILQSVSDAGAGTIAADTYQYRAVFEAVDARGNVHRSAPSNTLQITVGAGRRVDAVIQTANCTSRQRASGTLLATGHQEVVVLLYRSTDSITYQLVNARSSKTLNNPGVATVTITDDTATPLDELIYTDGGVLESDWVGGFYGVCRHRDRIFGASGTSALYYSSPAAAGIAPEFNLASRLEFPGEDVYAVASLDDLLVVFCSRAIYGVAGDGPGPTGDPTTGSFSVIKISSDYGCTNQRSIASTAQGIYFASTQGYMLLTRGRTIEWVGARVRDSFSAYPYVRCASYIPSARELRVCLGASATAGRPDLIVLNTQSGAWTTHVAPAAENTLAVGQTESGTVYQVTSAGVWTENTSYFDNQTAYSLTALSGWIAPDNPGTLKRFRRAVINGDRVGSSFGYSFRVERDYGIGTTTTWNVADGTVQTELRPRFHLPDQKSTAVRLQISDTPGAFGTGETLRVSSFGLEVGAIPGSARRPAAASY